MTRYRFVVLAGLAAVFAVLVSASAFAQGAFYREVAKDGRIYVFNIPSEFATWEKSGEMGKAITKVGYGPGGETMIFDSVEAIHLYNFKHDRPGDTEKMAEQAAPAPKQKVEWRDGKTRFTLGDNFYMEMSNRLQPRFTDEMPDDSVQLAGTEAKGDSKGSFRIRRAKFKIEGWFYKPELEYELQLNWVDASTTQPNRFVEDANIDWDFSKKKIFRVRFGQFKAPYGRQQLTSSGAQQFVDRSIVDERYNPARETGLALWGTLGTNKVDWRLMMSNGNSRSQSANDNAKYLFTGRVMWQAIGNARMNQWGSGALLTEGDLGDSQGKPLFAIAANFASNDKRFSNSTAGSTVTDDTTWGGDYVFKYKGFSSVGEYDSRRSKPYTDNVAKDRFDDTGFNFQAGYAFKGAGVVAGAAFWEVAFRYAEIDPTDLKEDDKRTEVGGVVSYYANKHNLKVQADFRSIKDDAGNSGAGVTNKEFRLQTQLVF